MSRCVWRRSSTALGVVLALPLGLAACSMARETPIPSFSMQPASTAAPRPRVAAQTRTTAGYKLGQPYRISNVWYVPREEPGFDRTGTGSWYGADFHGRKTANGETYNMNALTAAHPTLPLPSYVTVTNLANNRTILVRVNDRGPYVGGRLIDLSRAGARALGYEPLGTATLRVRYFGRAPLNGDDTRERNYLASQTWNANQVATGWDLDRDSRPSVQTSVPHRKAGPSAWSSFWGLGG